jgi:hypothetical protein
MGGIFPRCRVVLIMQIVVQKKRQGDLLGRLFFRNAFHAVDQSATQMRSCHGSNEASLSDSPVLIKLDFHLDNRFLHGILAVCHLRKSEESLR